MCIYLYVDLYVDVFWFVCMYYVWSLLFYLLSHTLHILSFHSVLIHPQSHLLTHSMAHALIPTNTYTHSLSPSITQSHIHLPHLWSSFSPTRLSPFPPYIGMSQSHPKGAEEGNTQWSLGIDHVLKCTEYLKVIYRCVIVTLFLCYCYVVFVSLARCSFVVFCLLFFCGWFVFIALISSIFWGNFIAIRSFQMICSNHLNYFPFFHLFFSLITTSWNVISTIWQQIINHL